MWPFITSTICRHPKVGLDIFYSVSVIQYTKQNGRHENEKDSTVSASL